MAAVARGPWSEALPAPARPGLEMPLVTERTDPSYGADASVLDGLEAEARRLGSVDLPFRLVREVVRSPGAVSILREHVVGTSGAELVRGLINTNRLLPLDVWLRFAVEFTGVPERAPCGPSEGGGLTSFGVDLLRRVRLFTDPLLDLVSLSLDQLLPPAPRVRDLRPLRFVSPEGLRGEPLVGASRVFAAASVLTELLITEPTFLRSTVPESLTAVLAGAPTWSGARHPACSPALSAVLARALEPDPTRRWADLQSFQAALVTAAGVAPASREHAALAGLSCAPFVLKAQLRALERAPDWMPMVWRQGGLEVLEDTLLDALLPAAEFATPTSVPSTAVPRKIVDRYAYGFDSTLSIPEMRARLNARGPWRWVERDNDRWGDYLSARAIEPPHEGLAKVLFDDELGRFAISLSVRSEAPDARAAFARTRATVLEQILPAIDARQVSEVDDYAS